MLKALLIDDEENGRISLRKKLDAYCPDVKLVAEGSGATEGLELIEKHRPDIVFLDIEMPGMDAFEMLNKLEWREFHLIFTTAHDQYAIEAIKNSAFDYLLKPVDIWELKIAVDKIKQQNLEHAKSTLPLIPNRENNVLNRIAIPTMEGLVFLSADDIMHIEAQSNYTVFYLVQQPKLTVSKTLKEIEYLLPAQFFFRVHHSHVINLKYVKKYFKGNGGHIELQDGSCIDVSRRKKDEFLRMIGH